jgi:Na+/H+ antiporter NhaD/arsenite permease-like protein
VDAFDEWSVVKDRRAFYAAVAVVVAVLLLFAVGDVLGVGLEFIAVAGAAVLLVLTRVIRSTVRASCAVRTLRKSTSTRFKRLVSTVLYVTRRRA